MCMGHWVALGTKGLMMLDGLPAGRLRKAAHQGDSYLPTVTQ